jgi:hypothetical protein
MSLPSFFAAAISSGEPKSCAVAGIAITLTTASAVNIDFMAAFLLLSYRHPARPTLASVLLPRDNQPAAPITAASSIVCTRLKAAALPVLPPS